VEDKAMIPKPKDKPAGKVKLTKPMETVLRLMASGWKLGSFAGYILGGRPWLHKGGIGRGGETIKTNQSTVHALWIRRLIVQNYYKFPIATYSLTPLGRRALKESSK
jgi:hypothetical protein